MESSQMINHVLYTQDIEKTANLELPWEKLQDASLLISGASGLVGTFLVDTIMYRNRYYDLGCHIYAIGRNRKKAETRFTGYKNEDDFRFVEQDINSGVNVNGVSHVDYIVHLASNTHPIAYAMDPIGTITTNIIGTGNLLEYAIRCECRRVAFASSNEVYGENRGDTELFDEDYCGYINCNTLRAGYPESKRCGEALCQAYIRQKGLDVVIPRLTRSYGPTMLMSDSKAMSQFIKKGLEGKNIVLKSEGNQYYSYTYVADAVSGLLTVLLKGKTGEAYNISNEKSDVRLKDLAKYIADVSGTKVEFELPDETEKAGYSTAVTARLCSDKLRQMGWKAEYDMQSGIRRTMEILRDCEKRI